MISLYAFIQMLARKKYHISDIFYCYDGRFINVEPAQKT